MKFEQSFIKEAYRLCLLGYNDKMIAVFFETDEATLTLWKQQQPAFAKSFRDGRTLADANVAEAMYQRALGYEAKEIDIRVIAGERTSKIYKKYYPPDTAAACLWLKLRQRSLWNEKYEAAAAAGGDREALRRMTEEELDAEIASLLKSVNEQRR